MVAPDINCDDRCDSTEDSRGVPDSSFELSDSHDSEPNDKIFLGLASLSCTLASFDETCGALIGRCVSVSIIYYTCLL